MLTTLLFSCGGSTGPSPDAGDTGMDAATLADAAADSGSAADASRPDASEPDATAADGGLDCSTIGCGAPPICGMACDAPCGCCACGDEGRCDGSRAINCNGSCYDVVECGAAACVITGGVAACESCASLEAAYERLTAMTACSDNGGCHLLFGHCGAGLGGCYHPASTNVTQDELDALSERWVALGCDAGRPVCRCAAPPATIRCEAGACVAP